MKKVLIILALVAFTASFAQENKNEKKETVLTKTEVKSDEGIDVSTKAVTKTEKQEIALNDSEANQTNQSVVMKPVQINTDVNYGYDGNRYKFLSQEDKNGYRLMTVKDNATKEEYAIIKPTSQNGYYILAQGGNTSFGYFNADGNFVVERYDPKTDAIISEIYKVEMNKDSVKKDKM